MGTKNNPGKFDCYRAAEDDEPMFILLARDPLAPILVNLWADMRVSLDIGKTEKATDALECAEAMRRWAAKHPNHGPLSCFDAGYDSVINGANTRNCDFRFFVTGAKTAAWERGAAAARERQKADGQ